MSYYSSDAAALPAAGFKQYCAPAALAPGWHGLELRYGKSPLDATSVFRFFVVDAAEVQTVVAGGVPANQILWKVLGPQPADCMFAHCSTGDRSRAYVSGAQHAHCAACRSSATVLCFASGLYIDSPLCAC